MDFTAVEVIGCLVYMDAAGNPWSGAWERYGITERWDLGE